MFGEHGQWLEAEMLGFGLAVVVALAVSPTTLGKDGIERVFEKNGVTVALGKAQGGCAAGEKEAAWIEPKGVIRGCWHESRDTVWIWWEDGDRSAVPAAIFVAPPAV